MENRQSAPRSGNFDAAEFERAFLAADYERCREIAQTAQKSDAAALALSRVDLREGRPVDVVERLSNLRPQNERRRIERDIWLGTAYAATGDVPSGLRLLERALGELRSPDNLFYTALFQKAHTLWMERRWEQLQGIVSQLLDAPDPLFRGRGYLMRAWIHAGKNRDARAQARDCGRALDEFDSMPHPDMRVRLSTLMSLSALARELGLESIAQRVRTAYEGLHPTGGMQVQYYKMTRILGWIDALDGDELAAFRSFRRAAELAPNDFWHVQCLTDRATLARAAGERAFVLDQLYAAHDMASRLHWNDALEEDRLTLLNLAELFADVDASLAQRYLAQFRSLRTPMDRRMGFSSDERVHALQAYPAGMALLRLGETAEAREMLRTAYEIFSQFDYGWRAALAALGLHKATHDPHWLSLARKAIKRWPNSWIAREIRTAQSRAESEEESLLTPAQRPILRLLMEGRRNADIAHVLGKSPHTIRNHIAEIFRAFDVTSRGELIALLSRRKQ